VQPQQGATNRPWRRPGAQTTLSTIPIGMVSQEHPNVTRLHAAFDAFGRGDLATLRALFTPTFVWHVSSLKRSGRSPRVVRVGGPSRRPCTRDRRHDAHRAVSGLRQMTPMAWLCCGSPVHGPDARCPTRSIRTKPSSRGPCTASPVWSIRRGRCSRPGRSERRTTRRRTWRWWAAARRRGQAR
jgi:hypothetical protein